jgi:hypothetical protein
VAGDRLASPELGRPAPSEGGLTWRASLALGVLLFVVYNATGKSTNADYVYVMELDNGKIRHMTKIWHSGRTAPELGWMS